MSWNKVESINHATLAELQQIILVLGSKLNLRIITADEGICLLELFCDSDDQLYLAESLIHQAYADLKLREEILLKGKIDISLIIESVLGITNQK